MSVISAPPSAIPSSLPIGSSSSNDGATKYTRPDRVRSSNTTCVAALALSTPCSASCGSVRGIAVLSSSHAATIATRPMMSDLERKAHPHTRQDRQLRVCLTRRAIRRVIVEVDEDVVRIVRIYHTEIRRNRGPTKHHLARDVQIQTLIRRKARRVARAA